MNLFQAHFEEKAAQIMQLEDQRTEYFKNRENLERKEKRVVDAQKIKASPEVKQGQTWATESNMMNLREKEAKIDTNLRKAREQQESLKEHIAQLTDHSQQLSRICDKALTFSLLNEESQPLASACARIQTVDFDVAFPRHDSINTARASSQALFELTNKLMSSHIYELVTDITQFVDQVSSEIDSSELSRLTALSRELTHALGQATRLRSGELLVDALHTYLAELITYRPLGRASPFLRAATRYIAWGLANYLSYWLRNKQSSPLLDMDQQKVCDDYLKLVVTLALLEERMEGNLISSEGIIIVREPRLQNS
jgi:hypothetical protein